MVDAIDELKGELAVVLRDHGAEFPKIQIKGNSSGVTLIYENGETKGACEMAKEENDPRYGRILVNMADYFSGKNT